MPAITKKGRFIEKKAREIMDSFFDSNFGSAFDSPAYEGERNRLVAALGAAYEAGRRAGVRDHMDSISRPL
jgi:hypothetical protein